MSTFRLDFSHSFTRWNVDDMVLLRISLQQTQMWHIPRHLHENNLVYPNQPF